MNFVIKWEITSAKKNVMALPSALQVRKYKGMMLEDLENALAEHAPAGGELASELPPLTIDGIPVSVDKMTQVSSCVINTSKRTAISHYMRTIFPWRGLYQTPEDVIFRHCWCVFSLPNVQPSFSWRSPGSVCIKVQIKSHPVKAHAVRSFTATLRALAISALCSPQGNQACLRCLPSAADAFSGSSSKQPGWQRPSERCSSTLGSLQPMAGPEISSEGRCESRACFSEGCRMRLSGVTCCLTEHRTRWKGSGACQLLDVVEPLEQMWNAFEMRVKNKEASL